MKVLCILSLGFALLLSVVSCLQNSLLKNSEDTNFLYSRTAPSPVNSNELLTLQILKTFDLHSSSFAVEQVYQALFEGGNLSMSTLLTLSNLKLNTTLPIVYSRIGTVLKQVRRFFHVHVDTVIANKVLLIFKQLFKNVSDVYMRDFISAFKYFSRRVFLQKFVSVQHYQVVETLQILLNIEIPKQKFDLSIRPELKRSWLSRILYKNDNQLRSKNDAEFNLDLARDIIYRMSARCLEKAIMCTSMDGFQELNYRSPNNMRVSRLALLPSFGTNLNVNLEQLEDLFRNGGLSMHNMILHMPSFERYSSIKLPGCYYFLGFFEGQTFRDEFGSEPNKNLNEIYTNCFAHYYSKLNSTDPNSLFEALVPFRLFQYSPLFMLQTVKFLIRKYGAPTALAHLKFVTDEVQVEIVTELLHMLLEKEEVCDKDLVFFEAYMKENHLLGFEHVAQLFFEFSGSLESPVFLRSMYPILQTMYNSLCVDETSSILVYFDSFTKNIVRLPVDRVDTMYAIFRRTLKRFEELAKQKNTMVSQFSILSSAVESCALGIDSDVTSTTLWTHRAINKIVEFAERIGSD